MLCEDAKIVLRSWPVPLPNAWLECCSQKHQAVKWAHVFQKSLGMHFTEALLITSQCLPFARLLVPAEPLKALLRALGGISVFRFWLFS